MRRHDIPFHGAALSGEASIVSEYRTEPTDGEPTSEKDRFSSEIYASWQPHIDTVTGTRVAMLRCVCPVLKNRFGSTPRFRLSRLLLKAQSHGNDSKRR